jgi:phosphoribosylformylglycinamidine (FGAM) synthase-like enzyme
MTDIEFETIAQTWSEHCVHKTFKAQITIQNPGDGAFPKPSIPKQVIDNLLKTYLRAPPTRSMRALGALGLCR